jgi:hypothetical protein
MRLMAGEECGRSYWLKKSKACSFVWRARLMLKQRPATETLERNLFLPS